MSPAPDNVADVTALLPMAQGVSVYASVRRLADTSFDGRSRGEVVADPLVERSSLSEPDRTVPRSG